MPCDLTNPIAAQNYGPPPPDSLTLDPRQCQDESGTIFFYSNRPESLTAANIDKGVLWADARDSVPIIINYRVWMWHRNASGNTPYRVCLTLENRGTSTLTVTGNGQQYVVQQVNSDIVHDIGQCVAQAQLANTLDPFTPLVTSIAPGTTRIIQNWNLSHLNGGDVVGAYLEFSVSPPFGKWTLRAVYGLQSDSDATITAKKTLIDKGEIGTGDGRGSWKATGFTGRNRVILSNKNNPYPMKDPPKRFGLGENDPNAADWCWDANDSYNPTQAVSNKGRYGVLYAPSGGGANGIQINYYYDQFLNGILNVSLVARNNGGVWAGVLWITGENRPRITEKIRFNTNPPLPGLDSVPVLSVNVPPNPPGTGSVFFRLAHAGGATLPVDVVEWTT